MSSNKRITANGPTNGALRDMSLTLTPAEIERLTGYSAKRPGLQVKELHRQGFYRARRGSVTGEVICERAHVEAVAAGSAAVPLGQARNRPKLRAVP
jgi:hypothetical protein